MSGRWYMRLLAALAVGWALTGCVRQGDAIRAGQTSRLGKPPRTNTVEALRKEAARTAEVESRAEMLARYAAGVSADVQGNTPQALSEYLEAAERDLANEPLVLEVAMRLVQGRQMERALQLLQKSATRTNVTALILSHLGWLNAQAGRTNDALAYSQRAWQMAPTNTLACRTLVTLYLEQKQPENALRCLETTARSKGDGVFYVELGDLMLSYNRHPAVTRPISTNQILQTLQQARGLLQEHPVHRVRLAELVEAAGDSRLALELYVELLEAFADAPPLRDSLRAKVVDLYLQGGRRQEAMNQLEAFLRDHPRNAQLWYVLGRLALEEQQYDRAGRWLKETIRLNPQYEPAYYDAALAMINTNQAQQALEVLQMARERFPAKFILEYFTGLAHARAEDYAAAIKAYTAAEIMAGATEPERLTAVFYFQVGVACERLKRFDEAASYFQKAIAQEPDFAEALNYLGYMWAEQGINLEQARELLTRALKLEPKNAAYLDSMGWIYFKLGDLERARSFVEEAIALSEKPDATLHDHLGDIYAAMKLWDKARAEWKKSLEIEPNENIRKKLESAPSS